MQSTQVKAVELPPLKDNDRDYEPVEKQIRRIWRDAIYLPLVKLLGEKSKVLQNTAPQGLVDAIKSGRIQFYRGTFSGRFSAAISKDLRALGAQWDRTTRTWKLPQSSLTVEVRNAILASEGRFQQKIDDIDDRLAKILPEEIADQLKISDHFDSTLWKVDRDLKGSLRNISVPPQLTPEQRKRIADEWQHNLKIPIKDWTQKEVVKLRKDIRESVYAGNRNEAVVKIIKDSHQTSIKKAKFLARQETRLLLTKFKQTRYEDAGVNEYKWAISNNPIAPSPNAPWIKGQVRHDHGVLAGKTFRWDTPPITNTLTGARNNPGQDFNCRCFAIPIVKFKGTDKK